jgi:2-dehydro-3-deoxyphosphogluconate aldolase/(4S)-4-hydroxy-2-oxoglutarate aldolase
MTARDVASAYDEALAEFRVVPIVVLDEPSQAAPLAEALAEGGLPVAEVTFRTPAAEDCLRIMAARPGMVVGAGTVTTAGQVEQAVAAGAQFVVSPGLSAAVVRKATDLGVPVLAGVSTATELMGAVELGQRRVKLFPVEPLGGTALVRALAGPFPYVRFVPSGGLTPDLATAYLKLRAVDGIGVSWITAPDLVRSCRYDVVAELAAKAAAMARSAA